LQGFVLTGARHHVLLGAEYYEEPDVIDPASTNTSRYRVQKGQRHGVPGPRFHGIEAKDVVGLVVVELGVAD
jgi:hypothetical protein